ncbi:MAG TPA: squalene synthase HpnC [Acidimicrobiales bacterium]
MTIRSFPYTQTDVAARARTENFTVASRVLPRPVRGHLQAFYAYARLVDEIGDAYEGDRRAALDEVEEQTRAALVDPSSRDVWPIVADGARSVSELGADPAALFDLIAANRQDQSIFEYATFDDLLAYCALSANPVGRLVLAAFGASGDDTARSSDSLCTGLQLAEHWQDVAEDAAAGRIYVPKDDLERFGVDPAALTAGPPASRAFRALMVFEVSRARRFLDGGQPLIDALHGTARWAVAGFWGGGHAALDAIAARRFDVLAGTPRASRARALTRAVSALIRPTTRQETA